jgi:hypothetical protein
MAADREAINDFRVRFFGASDRVVALVCECADPGCRRAVRLTRAEDTALREQGIALLYPSHIPTADAPLKAEIESSTSSARSGSDSTQPLNELGRGSSS